MTVAPLPKSRGRPRKNPVPIMFDKNLNVVNPDKEVATRGYVKCVARKVICNGGHKHQLPTLDITDNFTMASFLLVFVSIVGLILSSTLPPFEGTWLFPSSVSVLVMSLAYFAAGLSSWKSQDATDRQFTDREFTGSLIYPPEIERWEPPEPKKEC